MRRALALAAALGAAALAGPAASAATVCAPETPASGGCVTVYYAPGHLCVTGTVTVAGVPVVDRPPCR